MIKLFTNKKTLCFAGIASVILFLTILTFIKDENALFLYLNKQRDHVKAKAKLVTLNHFIPSFDDLAHFIQKKERSINKDILWPYIKYYQKVIDTFPNMADAHTVLGFCYYYSGQKEEAAIHFKKSLEINPKSVITLYNLSLTFCELGKYKQALELAQGAISIHPERALKMMYSSKIYQQIRVGMSQAQQERMVSIKILFRRCHLLLMLSRDQLKQPQRNILIPRDLRPEILIRL